MRVSRMLGGALAAAVALGALSACGGDSSGDGGEDPIEIGVISPLTGPSSDPGQRVREGAEVAAIVINKAGGVDGRKIKLTFADDKSTPEQGVLKLQELSGKGVKYFTGTVNSTVAIAIGNFLKASKDVYVTTAAQAQDPLDAQENGNIFAMSNTNAAYGEVYLPWVVENIKPKTVAVLAESSDYGNNEIASLKSAWSGPGAPKMITERFDREQSDYSAQLTKLLSQKPDALYAVAGGTELPAKVLKQAADLGFEGQGLSGPGTISDAFIKAGGSAVEGVISANVYATGIPNATNKEFVKQFEAKFGRAPSAEAALGYDSVSIIVDGLKKAGDDPAAVAKAMKAGTWSTTRGDRGFDATGRLKNETLIVKVEDGKISIVE